MNKKAILKQVNAQLRERGIKDSALPLVVETCLDDMELAQVALDQHGLVIDDERGSMKLNPAQGVRERARAMVIRSLNECGLTVKTLGARGKPGIEDEDPIDSMPDL